MTTELRPIAVCGDWHGDVGFGIDAIRSAAAAGARTILHVGDFAIDWPGAKRGRFEQRVNRQLLEHDVTLICSGGNHDNWETLLTLPVGPSGLAQWRSNIYVLPRGGRTVIDGLTVGALGGAYSIDQQWRTEGKNWWADEEPTAEEAEKLVAGDRVDLLVTHDVPMGVPMQGDFELPPEIVARADETRVLLQDVVDRVRPELVFCGHWHQRKIHELLHESGEATAVHVLADENSRAGNAVLLRSDNGSLRVEPMLIRGN